jgi:RHS repeat-associated protein
MCSARQGRSIAAPASDITSLGTTNYLYSGDNLTNEMDNAGTILARYAQGAGADEPLSEVRSSVLSYYQEDALGSVSSVANSAGSIVETYNDDSFGRPVASTGSVTNFLQYTASELDPETGIYFDRARYYDPEVGRFLNEDPIRSMGGLNFYAYVRNDSTNLTDTSGLAPDWWKNLVNWWHPPSPDSKPTAPGSPCVCPFDTSAFVSWMNSHASKGSGGSCAKAVRMGLQKGFGQTPTDRNTWDLPVPAKDYGPALTSLDFTDVTQDPNYYTNQPGDIVVMQPVTGQTNENGHIAVWNGSQWVSDYMQKNFQPYSGATIKDLTIYRYHGCCGR